MNGLNFFIFIFLLVVINSILVKSIILYLIIIILVCRYFYLKYNYKQHLKMLATELKQSIIYSPINGKIENIVDNENGIIITFKHNFIKSNDLCIPYTGLINDVNFDSKVFGQLKENNLAEKTTYSFKIKTKTGFIKINIQSVFKVLNLLSIIQDGDFCQVGSIMGEIPRMGKLFLKLPLGVKTNLKIGENVSMGKSPIAFWS